MLTKKTTGIIALLLILIMVITSCSGKTVTTAPVTTTAPVITTTTPPPDTTAAVTTTPPPATTTAASPGVTAVPKVTLSGISGITMNSVLIEGDLAAGQTADRLGFDWGTSPGTYQSDWEEKGNFMAGSFSYFIEGLTEGTTYYYRAKAHNSQGWGYSAEKSFRTLGIPKISGVTADYGLLGQTLDVVINGIDFIDVTNVSLGAGITVNSYTVASDTRIDANISIAAGAATGARTVTVTSFIGTGTLADGFTVKQISQVKHSFIWTDSQFNQILHDIAPGPAYDYVVHFHDNNQITLITTRSYTNWVELRNGKLCIIGISSTTWNDLFASASPYLSYDVNGGVMTFEALPDSMLQTMLDVPVDVLPAISSLGTSEGLITINYYATEEVI